MMIETRPLSQDKGVLLHDTPHRNGMKCLPIYLTVRHAGGYNVSIPPTLLKRAAVCHWRFDLVNQFGLIDGLFGVRAYLHHPVSVRVFLDLAIASSCLDMNTLIDNYSSTVITDIEF